MAPPILFVRNDPSDTLGIAPEVYTADGIPFETVEAHAGQQLPPLEGFGGVVMFGGEMNVDHVSGFPFLREVRDLAGRAVEQQIPFLGICLGGQLLARALGAAVPRAPEREIGFEPIEPADDAAGDPLLSVYGPGDRVFHWHEDMVELPDGALQLARGMTTPVQAFRVGEVAWGVQFHFEIDRGEISRWAGDFTPGELAAVWGKSREQLGAEADRHLAAHRTAGTEVFRRFARVVAEGSPRSTS
ncbi:MAG: type 1 glutamine amidotransferase [Actinomycetota bacterium]